MGICLIFSFVVIVVSLLPIVVVHQVGAIRVETSHRLMCDAYRRQRFRWTIVQFSAFSRWSQFLTNDSPIDEFISYFVCCTFTAIFSIENNSMIFSFVASNRHENQWLAYLYFAIILVHFYKHFLLLQNGNKNSQVSLPKHGTHMQCLSIWKNRYWCNTLALWVWKPLFPSINLTTV